MLTVNELRVAAVLVLVGSVTVACAACGVVIWALGLWS